jgi:DNA-binding transcriptional MerR regulator
MIPEIPDKIFFKIGEVANILNVEQHVLRYWEEEFEALKPGKNRSGQRMYQKKDVEIALEIQRLLYTEKYTIAGAKQKLQKRPKNPAQMNFGFNREQLLKWKKNLEEECRSILKVLDEKPK